MLFEKLSCNLFYILLLESGNTIPTSFKLKIQKQIPDILSTKSKVTLFLSERIKKSFPLFLLRLSFISLDKLGLEFFKKVDEELGGDTHRRYKKRTEKKLGYPILYSSKLHYKLVPSYSSHPSSSPLLFLLYSCPSLSLILFFSHSLFTSAISSKTFHIFYARIMCKEVQGRMREGREGVKIKRGIRDINK